MSNFSFDSIENIELNDDMPQCTVLIIQFARSKTTTRCVVFVSKMNCIMNGHDSIALNQINFGNKFWANNLFGSLGSFVMLTVVAFDLCVLKEHSNLLFLLLLSLFLLIGRFN